MAPAGPCARRAAAEHSPALTTSRRAGPDASSVCPEPPPARASSGSQSTGCGSPKPASSFPTGVRSHPGAGGNVARRRALGAAVSEPFDPALPGTQGFSPSFHLAAGFILLVPHFLGKVDSSSSSLALPKPPNDPESRRSHATRSRLRVDGVGRCPPAPRHPTWAPAGQSPAGADPRRALLSHRGVTHGRLPPMLASRCTVQALGPGMLGTGRCPPGSACSRCPTSPAASRCNPGLELRPRRRFFPPFPRSLSPASLRARSVRFSPRRVLITGIFLLSRGSLPSA